MQRLKAITSIPGWLSDYTGSGIPDSTAALYSSVPLLFRAVRLRADALSAVPVKIMKIVDGEEKEKKWPYPEPLETLIWRAEASLLLTGGAYWEIVGNAAGYQKDVKNRNPFGMAVEYKDGKIVFKQGRAKWENDLTKGRYEMVYFADYDPERDVLPGVGAGEVARVDARLLNALSAFPEKFFEGGAMPVTMIGVDSTDTSEIQRVENWIKRSATSIRNAFRILAFRAGALTQMKLTPDLDTLAMPELAALAKNNIEVAFGIPDSMMDTTASNKATAEEARLGFYEDQIKPRARMFENTINTQLLAKDKLKLTFDFESMAIFQEDEADRATVLQSLTGAGTPLRLAFDLAGYTLTDEQLAMLADEDPEPEPAPVVTTPVMQDAVGEELRRWQRMAEKRIRAGKPVRDFDSEIIPAALNGAIAGQLEGAKSVEDIKAVFHTAMEWRAYP